MILAQFKIKHYGDFHKSEVDIISETKEGAYEELFKIIPQGLCELVDVAYYDVDVPGIVSIRSEKKHLFKHTMCCVGSDKISGQGYDRRR